jgi:uncharacterized glyoxalase superfamily protein PhnB
MTALEAAIPVLPVADVPKAVAFYRDRLGFTPLFEYGPYAGVRRGPIEFHLNGHGAPGPAAARIAVRGVDELYAELEKKGVIHPNEPLETKPFGMRQFSVLDADGNTITFAEPVSQPGAAAQPAKRRFMIGFTHVEGATSGLKKEDIPRMIESHRTWAAETDSQPNSSLVYFAPASEAKNVRLHADGRLEVQDGTFAGGKEALGGFTIIEAESLEEALEYAKRHRWLPGSNEVREIKTPPNLRAWIRSR